jgi:hypothetical protein
MTMELDEQTNENIKKINTWKRIGFILIFSVIIGLVRTLLWGVILLQIISTLLTGSPNKNILNFGQKLAAYTYHILLFLTFNTDETPYPFADWNATEEVVQKDLHLK